MGERVGVGIAWPVEVVLARQVESIAATARMPGGTRWEPKWDGYRLVAAVDEGGGARLWSRRGTDLTAAFPDVAGAVVDQVPAGTVLDGELVIWTAGALDFGALQRRMASTRAARQLARLQPANVAVFDLLQHAGVDQRRRPLSERRGLLEETAAGWSPPLQLSPYTTDPDVAAGWFRDMAAAGIEGLVAKGADQPYRGGRRDWLKVKQRSVLDVVCAAVVGPVDRPTVVVAGLRLDGELRIVGRTGPLSPIASRELGRLIREHDGQGHPWPAVSTSATLNGWGTDRNPVALTRIEPIVVEVSADVAWSGRSFRHLLRYVRVRPELHPGEVSPPPTTA